MKFAITQLFLFLTFFSFQIGHTQTWVWMHSTDTLNVDPINGTLNVSTVDNRPGSLEGSAYWTDLSGDFWMFGGQGYFNATLGLSNDLWKFDVASNSWKRVLGNSSASTATYGVMNVPNATNSPGGRMNAATWVDNAGNLWMFGGYGVTTTTTQGYLNDLWTYNISSGQWTWVGGSNALDQLGLYGTMSVSSSTNMPGGRSEACFWKVGNYCYLYGGSGCSANTTTGYLGDLWRYDLTINEWVWLKGSTTNYLAANHGTQGQSAASNSPGCRSSAMCWKDNSNNIWLGGGLGFWSGFGTCTWADLWRYDASTNNWTWIKGSNVPFTSPQYGSLGVGTSTTDPGARTGCATWTDVNGDFWLFGGDSYYQAALNDYSDLWKYSLSANQWIWIKGPSSGFQAGSYGTQFFPLSSNNPPFRKYAATWKDNSGNFWMHGGISVNGTVTPTNRQYADLWKLNTCTIVPSAPSAIISSTNSACGGSSLSFTTGSSSQYVFWLDVSTNTIMGMGTAVSNTFAAGIYTISAVSVNNCSTSANNPVLTVTLFANPTVSVTGGSVCLGRTYTMNPSGCANYTFSNGSNTVAPNTTSSYSIVGANAQGCLSSNTAVCNVTVLTTPTVSVNNGSLCAGLTFSMFPTGATTYSYSSGSFISMNVQASGIYTVVGAYPNGCRDTAYASLTVYQLPTVSLSSGSICAGQSFSLIPSGASIYTLSSGSPNVSPAQTSTYSVMGTSSDGCVSAFPGIATVSVFANPIISIVAESATVCNGEVRTFTATGGAFYTWNIGQSTPQVTVSFALTTLTLNVAAIDVNGCANTASLVVYTQECLGVEKFDNAKPLTLYPNPFENAFTLYTESEGALKVYDLFGKLILQSTLLVGTNVFDLAEQPAGLYMAVVSGNGREETVRLVKR